MLQDSSNSSKAPGSQKPAGPNWLRRSIDAVTMGLNVIGTVLIVAIMLLVNADVIGRGAFGMPISGVPEMVSMSIVAIVFLQVAQTFKMGRLTRSDAVLNIINRRSLRFRATVELVFCLAATAIIYQLLSASYPLFVKSWKRNTFEGTIGDFTAPIWPVKLIILIGCVVLIIQLLLSAWDAFLQIRSGETQVDNDEATS